jgi:hypothetical protein
LTGVANIGTEGDPTGAMIGTSEGPLNISEGVGTIEETELEATDGTALTLGIT